MSLIGGKDNISKGNSFAVLGQSTEMSLESFGEVQEMMQIIARKGFIDVLGKFRQGGRDEADYSEKRVHGVPCSYICRSQGR